MHRTMMTLLTAAGLALCSLSVLTPLARAEGPPPSALWPNVNRPAHEVLLAEKPDLVVVGVAGPTSISAGNTVFYTTTIRNDGSAANGDVEIKFGMLGVLSPGNAKISPSIPFFCVQNDSAIDCTGGTLAAGQQATITIPVEGFVGQGSIFAAINDSRLVDESNYQNDLVLVDVTVTK